MGRTQGNRKHSLGRIKHSSESGQAPPTASIDTGLRSPRGIQTRKYSDRGRRQGCSLACEGATASTFFASHIPLGSYSDLDMIRFSARYRWNISRPRVWNVTRILRPVITVLLVTIFTALSRCCGTFGSNDQLNNLRLSYPCDIHRFSSGISACTPRSHSLTSPRLDLRNFETFCVGLYEACGSDDIKL